MKYPTKPRSKRLDIALYTTAIAGTFVVLAFPEIRQQRLGLLVFVVTMLVWMALGIRISMHVTREADDILGDDLKQHSQSRRVWLSVVALVGGGGLISFAHLAGMPKPLITAAIPTAFIIGVYAVRAVLRANKHDD